MHNKFFNLVTYLHIYYIPDCMLYNYSNNTYTYLHINYLKDEITTYDNDQSIFFYIKIGTLSFLL